MRATQSETIFRRYGFGLLVISFATDSWNAVFIHRVQLGDVFLAAAAAFLGFDFLRTAKFPRRTLTQGMWAGALMIGVSGIWTALSPPSPEYMAARNTGAPTVVASVISRPGGNLTQLAKFEVALIVLPVLVLMTAPGLRRLRILADAWMFATVVNAAVAIADRYAHTGISRHLLGAFALSGRQAGLTQQPNHLALAIAMALPVAIAWLIRTRRQLVGLAIIAVLVFGLYLTGSRGGFIGGIAAVPVTLYLHRPSRRYVWWIGLAGAVGVVAYGPQLLNLVLGRGRVGGTAGSDLARSVARHQGWADFWSSPIHGIGYSVIDDAHEVHIQMLAAGGLIALIGFAIYMAASVRVTWRAARIDDLYARALVASLVVWLMTMFVENQVSDRYLFVPVAIALAMGRLEPSPDLTPQPVPLGFESQVAPRNIKL